MAEYKGIHGTKVQDYTTDPDNPITGQVWYNETANTLRVEALTTAGSWATGGSLNTGRYTAADNIGIQTSALCATGQTPAYTANVENYNGSAWTEVNNVNTARSNAAGAGTTT